MSNNEPEKIIYTIPADVTGEDYYVTSNGVYKKADDRNVTGVTTLRN